MEEKDRLSIVRKTTLDIESDIVFMQQLLIAGRSLDEASKIVKDLHRWSMRHQMWLVKREAVQAYGLDARVGFFHDSEGRIPSYINKHLRAEERKSYRSLLLQLKMLKGGDAAPIYALLKELAEKARERGRVAKKQERARLAKPTQGTH